MASRTSANYAADEVEAIVDLYSEVKPGATALSALVRIWDVDTALRAMPPKEYQAVLLIGLIGLDTRTAGHAMGASHTTMWRRYQRGIEWITNYLNGRT